MLGDRSAGTRVGDNPFDDRSFGVEGGGQFPGDDTFWGDRHGSQEKAITHAYLRTSIYSTYLCLSQGMDGRGGRMVHAGENGAWAGWRTTSRSSRKCSGKLALAFDPPNPGLLRGLMVTGDRRQPAEQHWIRSQQFQPNPCA